MNNRKKKGSGKPQLVQMARIALKDLLPIQEQREKKDPRSKQLINLLTRIPVVPIKKLEDWRDKIFELSRKEGFDDMLTGKWVRHSMSEAGYSERHVQRLLPETAKQEQDHVKRRNDNVTNGTEADKMSASSGSVTEDLTTQQQIDDEAPAGYYQIPIEQFDIRDVEQYDRDFLIEVVRHIHNKLVVLEEKLKEEDREIKELSSELRGLKKK